MTTSFEAFTGSGDWIDATAAWEPENPFLTPAYAASRGRQGETAWWFSTPPPAQVRAVAFVRAGRISRTAQIPSRPSCPADHPFWTGLLEWARAQRISSLVIDSYASGPGPTPVLGPEQREPRTSFRVDLTPEDPFPDLSSSHRRQLKRAQKAGLTLRFGAAPDDLANHVALMETARERRGGGITSPIPTSEFRPFLEAGAGVLAQVVQPSDEQVVASALILRSAKGGYHHSSGSSRVGNEIGATHFLFVEVARRLREEGATRFYLGGVRNTEEGLRTFKERFGVEAVPLERVVLDLATPWQRVLRWAVRFSGR